MARTHDGTLLPVAETVSAALGTPIEELPPLSESINPDGLAAIVGDDGADDVTVSFPYAGLRVFVHSGGLVYARPADDEVGSGSGTRYVHGR